MVQKIAVIGSGISGLVCAHLLSQRYAVHLFEANDRLGGHTYTHTVHESERRIHIDCGFIVFNHKNYPNFVKLLSKHSELQFAKSEMSFSYFSQKNNFFYNGHSLMSLFADSKNWSRIAFYTMLFDIMRFNHQAKRYLKNPPGIDVTLSQYLQHKAYGTPFLDYYFIPMISAIWSCPLQKCLDMPATAVLHFFAQHGLLDYFFRPQWYTIQNGASQYVPQLLKHLPSQHLHLNAKVQRIERTHDKVMVDTGNNVATFDKVIIATHSDEALAMLDKPTQAEEDILQAIRYEKNNMTLHCDSLVMPPLRRAWASWNFLQNKEGACTVTYYANKLQSLNCENDYFVSLNLDKDISPEKIIHQFTFAHPVLDMQAMTAQKKINLINGAHHTFFCGAYWGYGFHEDGVNSALRVCEALGVSNYDV